MAAWHAALNVTKSALAVKATAGAKTRMTPTCSGEENGRMSAEKVNDNSEKRIGDSCDFFYHPQLLTEDLVAGAVMVTRNKHGELPPT